MMKKVVLLLFLLVFLLSSCQKKETEKIIVGTPDDFPPFIYEENGELVGFDVELMKIIFKNLSLEPEYKIIPFDESLNYLKEGRVRILLGGYPLQFTYPKDVSLTLPYFDISLYIISKKERPICSVEELEDKKVILSLYTFSEDILRRVKNVEKIPFEDLAKSLSMIEEGKADALIIEKPLMDIYGVDKEKFNTTKIYEQGYTIVLKSTDTELREKLNVEIGKILNSKEYKNLLIKWFSLNGS
ncbi:MAG: amino acid ABC transporter substrate-binding protein [Caldisericia bacterium]|nr:amino acid ABC transporter substrate-binding protein [Caldisericia bacterium]